MRVVLVMVVVRIPVLVAVFVVRFLLKGDSLRGVHHDQLLVVQALDDAIGPGLHVLSREHEDVRLVQRFDVGRAGFEGVALHPWGQEHLHLRPISGHLSDEVVLREEAAHDQKLLLLSPGASRCQCQNQGAKARRKRS